MCRFTRPVRSVSATKIFAGHMENGEQALVYQMTLWSEEDLAMVLALPVLRGTGESAVTFVNLSGYPGIFAAIDRGFGESERSSRRGGPRPRPVLKVVDVGSFQASYVPTFADFDRLDPRFRLPHSVLGQQPGQEEFGFAVFMLKSGSRAIHPMALRFPRASPDTLFFPTIHVHDGLVHPTAHFDHTLDYQRRDGERSGVLSRWVESKDPAGSFMTTSLSMGLVHPERHIYRTVLHGTMKNQDVHV